MFKEYIVVDLCVDVLNVLIVWLCQQPLAHAGLAAATGRTPLAAATGRKALAAATGRTPFAAVTERKAIAAATGRKALAAATGRKAIAVANGSSRGMAVGVIENTMTTETNNHQDYVIEFVP